MNKLRTIIGRAAIATMLISVTALAQSPALFFTDLESGPKTGGENDKGAYVTIYGNFFGSSQGTSTVTVGGGAVDHCPIWGATWLWYQKITCQLGPRANTGNIVVTVNGQASSGFPFTVRSGKIVFVDVNSGKNTNDGSFTRPWKDAWYAKDFMGPGGIAYLRAGTWSTVEPGFPTGAGEGASCLYMAGINNGALIGYPGETATIACNRGGQQSWDIRTATQPSAHWTFAELNLAGTPGTNYIIAWENAYGGDGLRIVGNEIHGSTGSAVVMQGSMNGTAILGNNIHHYWALENGANHGERGYGLYFGGYGTQQNLAVKWNRFDQDQNTANASGTKGIQIYGHLSVDEFRNVVIANNQFWNHCREAIEMGGSDGGTAVLKDDNFQNIYNNLFVHNGECDQDYGYSALTIQSGKFVISNNTFYFNGNSPRTSPSGDINNQGVISAIVSNNIFEAPSPAGRYCGYICVEGGGKTSQISGSNNLFLNFGNGPSYLNGNIKGQEPLFVHPTTSPTNADFHLQPNSPARNAGVKMDLVTADITGTARSQGVAYDVGAYSTVTNNR